MREEFKIMMDKNSNLELESNQLMFNPDYLERLIERMNDIIKALTKQMADRHDTKKHFRIVDN